MSEPNDNQKLDVRLMERLGIADAQELNKYAIVLAQHCAGNGAFFDNEPGWIAKFDRGTTEINMKDIEEGSGDENLSFIFVNEGVIAEFYEHEGFKGRSFSMEGPDVFECLVANGFNDIISSIRLTYTDPVFRFAESATKPADGFLPYTPDSYDDDETQFNVMHNGKRYVVRTNSYSLGNHALTLFIDPTNNPGLTYWAAQSRKSSSAFYYKGYEGTMVVGEGDWVEIQYPEARAMTQYTLHYNLMTTGGAFVDLDDVPPTGWVILGSNDGTQWDILDENNAGKSGWMKSEWSDFSDIRDGSITQKIGSAQPYTHFRLLVTRWGDDLSAEDTSTFRRLDRWVLGLGSESSTPTTESDDSVTPSPADSTPSAASPPPSSPPTPSATTKSSNFLSDYKWYLLGAILLVLALVMFL